MTFKEKVSDLLKTALEERPSLFLIEFSITGANKIMVTLDGDNGVNLQDCIDISRAIALRPRRSRLRPKLQMPMKSLLCWNGKPANLKN
jgi:hypothetical protein